MRTCAPLFLGLLSLLAVLSPVVWAEDATEAFNSLYGEDMKRVAASSDSSDDVLLAAKLLTAAKANTGQLDMVRLLCENAYTLGSKTSAGYPTAMEAMELLIAKLPDKKAEYQQKLLTVSLRQYEIARSPERARVGESLVSLLMELSDDKVYAGETAAAVPLAEKALRIAGDLKMPTREIQDHLKELSDKLRAERTVAAMKARLTANVQDMPARTQLILSLLVDLDNPTEAGKFLDPACDATTLTYVPLAAKDLKDLEDFNCLALAEWYQGLVGKTISTSAKIAMLTHAKNGYGAYLEKHPADDLNRTKAKLALDKVEEQLAKLTPPEDASTWPDLLKLVDLSKHSISGKWELASGKLSVVSDKHSRMMIPVAVDGSYRMQVKFTRSSGTGALVVILPAGANMCELVLGGFGGDTSGLSLIHGQAGDRNDSNVKLPKFVNKQEYTADIDVVVRDKDVSVSVDLNGKKYIRWQGEQSALSMEDDWKIFRAPRALGFGVQDATITISSARMKLVSGSVKMLDEKTDTPSKWTPGPSGWNGGGGGGGGGRGWGGGRRH